MRALLIALLPALVVAVDGPPPEGPSLTIYSAADPAAFDPQASLVSASGPYPREEIPGFAVVRETRVLDLRAGENRIDVTDIAARIDPATVDLVDVLDPAAVQVLEQRFLIDRASPEQLIQRYVGQVIDLVVPVHGQPEQRISATLLATHESSLVLGTADGVRFSHVGYHNVRLGDIPGELITKPTLRWLVHTPAAGRRTVQRSYHTGGLTWRADYRLVLDADGQSAALGAWVTILNASGASWNDARLTLMAGDVDRSPSQNGHRPPRPRRSDGASPSEKASSTYHRYPIDRRTDLQDRRSQQIALFPSAAGVRVSKLLIYDGAIFDEPWIDAKQPRLQRDAGTRSDARVEVHVRFENSEANGLGMPLPRGRFRLYRASEGQLELIGEDLIDHLAKDRPAHVRIGLAEDITGERAQIGFEADPERRTMSERIGITLRNAKSEPVMVTVREHFHRWSAWQVVQQSDRFEKQDARTGHFAVEVPANGEKQLEYEVRYTW